MNRKRLTEELNFRTSRSRGKGGQNVNKLETKVELTFNTRESLALNEAESALILKRLAGKIDKSGIIRITSDAERSQYLNKQRVIEKFFKLIEKALTPSKIRTRTSVPLGEIKKRRVIKKKISEKKSLRKLNLEEEIS